MTITVAATPVSRHTAQAPDLDALAAIVRDEHRAFEVDARNAFAHAAKAGAALLAAKEQVGHGHWLPWLDRSGVPERRAQRYMAAARARDELAANPTAVSDLSLRVTVKKPTRPKATATPKRATSLDVLIGWWSDASLEDRRSFLDSAGQRAIDEARPPSWQRADAIGASNTGEIAHLNVRIEEIERELHQRDLVIAGLRRQLDAEPSDDGLAIPESLIRRVQNNRPNPEGADHEVPDHLR